MTPNMRRALWVVRVLWVIAAALLAWIILDECATRAEGPKETVVWCVAGSPGDGYAGPWYNWNAHGPDVDGVMNLTSSGWDEQRAILHKLASDTTGAPAYEQATDAEFAWIETRARVDANRERVWLAFNEPDLLDWAESGYRSHPEQAAQVYARFWRAVKGGCPTCRVGAPNIYFASDESDWPARFLAALEPTGAQIDVWCVHDYFGRYNRTLIDYGDRYEYDLTLDYRGLSAHLTQLDTWRAAWPELFAEDLEIWVTETGILNSDDDPFALMDAIARWPERWRIVRWYWFVSYDPDWEKSAPQTLLWTASGSITPTGKAWLGGQAGFLPSPLQWDVYLPLLYFPGEDT